MGESKRRLLVYKGADVAEAFDVEPTTVSGWLRQGMPVEVHGKGRVYDLDKIYEWKLARDNALIATNNGQHPSPLVADAMPKMGELQEKVDEFKLHRADILAAAQLDSLNLQNRIKELKLANLTDEELMKLTNSEAARWFQLLGVDFAIKFDKERLERGESTENVAKIISVIKTIKREDGQG